MKRYVLKKDLPIFNKGETFIFDGDLWRESDNMMAYSQSELNEYPNILKEWFEEIPEECKRWRAEDKQEYFYIDGEGFVRCIGESFFSCDDRRYELGNYFKTMEEAGKALDSLAELNAEWEDYAPTGPLIKDEKIRKAVIIGTTRSDYEKIKHLERMVDAVIEGGDTASERSVLLEVQEMLSDALIMEVE